MVKNFDIGTLDTLLEANNLFRETVGKPPIDLKLGEIAVHDHAPAEDNPLPPLLGELGVKVYGWQYGRVRDAHQADAA